MTPPKMRQSPPLILDITPQAELLMGQFRTALKAVGTPGRNGRIDVPPGLTLSALAGIFAEVLFYAMPDDRPTIMLTFETLVEKRLNKLEGG